MKLESRTLKLLFVISSFLILGANFAWPQNPEQDIEILEAIEILGTAAIGEERQFFFPNPGITDFPPSFSPEALGISAEFSVNHNLKTEAVALDPIGMKRGVKIHPKVIKEYTPPYPPSAKKLNWEGTALLLLTIEPDGTVSEATIHTSSGYDFLDNFAIESIKHFIFEPKKDGEFSLKGKVKYPFHFNID